jgi:replicative DNA helicase
MSTQELPLPKSEHIEVTTLGAIMLEPGALVLAQESLRVADFALDSHKRIYAAILHLAKSTTIVDPSLVIEELERRRELDAIGGRQYIHHLTEGVPRKFDISSYAKIIREKARLRAVMKLASRIESEASDEQEDSQHLLERLGEEVKDLEEDTPDVDMQSVGTYLATQGDDSEALESMATTGGLMLGWTQWDECTGGLQPGELIVLAAMASSGKTAWACNAAYYTSVVLGKITAYFPLEDGRGAVVRRMVSSASGVDHRAIRDANLSQYDQSLVLEHRARLAAAPLYLDETPEMTMSRIRAKCARLKRQGLAAGHPTGLDLIIIDQLSHTENTDVYERGVNPEEIIGRQAKAAKKIGKELKVPVILLAQLTQEAAKRTDPTPRITDLAGSGKIKNHADIVAFLHRPELFNKDDEALKGVGHMILAKNRQGETKTCVCAYRPRILRWEDDTPPTPRQTAFEAYQAAYRD